MKRLRAIVIGLAAWLSVGMAPSISAPASAGGVQCAAPSPAPNAKTAAVVSCSSQAPSDWIARLRQIAYTSQSGDIANLSQAMGGFAHTLPPGAPPWAEYDPTNGLLLICMWPAIGNRCEHSVYVRSDDVGVPNGAVPATLSQPAIGMTLDQLLERFNNDPNLASKSLKKGTHGQFIMVTALDEFPGPKEYDHGMQSYSYQLYLLSDGIVVAAATQLAEN